MDPVTWGVIIAGVGTALSATAMVQQGRAANEAGDAQAALDANNAKIAARNAEAEVAQQKKAALSINAQRDRILGQQSAAAAGSGLVLNGSVLDVMSDTALQSEIDLSNSYTESNNRVNAYLQQSSDFKAQGSMASAAGKNAQTSSYWGAGGTLLSGAGSVLTRTGRTSTTATG